MKRPDYRVLQALDAVIRERGFERAAQKLCITQSAVSQRIKQLEYLYGQPLLIRTVPPKPTEQGQKLLALLRQVELLEDEWLSDEGSVESPLQLALAVNADSLATWLLPALKPVLSDSPIRLNLQVEDETRTQERLRLGEVVGAVSIQPQALPRSYWWISSERWTISLSLRRNLPIATSLTGSPAVRCKRRLPLHLTTWTICIRRFYSRTSTYRRAACPATSSARRKPSSSWQNRVRPAA